jgi:hypothetical protein
MTTTATTARTGSAATAPRLPGAWNLGLIRTNSASTSGNSSQPTR